MNLECLESVEVLRAILSSSDSAITSKVTGRCFTVQMDNDSNTVKANQDLC